jgi:hypothetical protein
MIYKVFVDDSGNKEYKNPYSQEFLANPPIFAEYSQFWRDNYFVLCTVRIHQKKLGQINAVINRLKVECFKTHAVEIKSAWLRNPINRKKYYLEKYAIDEAQLHEFTEKIYIHVINAFRQDLKLIAVVFDKRFYGDTKRNTQEGNPLMKCTQVLLERLQYTKAYHLVYFDQFEQDLRIYRGAHKKVLSVVYSPA